MLRDARRASASRGNEGGRATARRRVARRSLPAVSSLISSVLLCGSLAAPAWPQPAGGGDDSQAPQEVVHSENGFTIHATNADLPRLLTAVGNQAGFSVVDSGHNHQPLSVWITDAPLDVTLRRLLREANYILVYREGKRSTEISSDGIDQIILLTSKGQASAPGGNASPLTGPQPGVHPAAPPAPPGAPPPGAMPPGAVPGAFPQVNLPPPAVATAPGAPGQPQLPQPRRLRANQAQAQIQPGDLEAMGLDPNLATTGAVGAAGGRRGMFEPPGAAMPANEEDDSSGDEE